MSEFVDECRQEWRRLGVSDPIANEMAADLAADLEEAEAEGGSAEDVLGNSAFDPRQFAAAWAAARGVTGTPVPDRPHRRRSPVAVVVAALLGVLTVLAALALLVGFHRDSFAVAAHRIIAGPGPVRIIPAGPGRFVVPGPLGSFVGPHMHVVGARGLVLLLLVGGLVGLGVLAVRHVWPRPGARRCQQESQP